MSAPKSKSRSYHCQHVYTKGSKSGQTCNNYIYETGVVYCKSHVKCASKKSVVKKKPKIRIETDSESEQETEKVKSKKKSVVKKKTKKEEEQEEKQIIFEYCDENPNFLLNVDTRLLITKDRKVIGQYHLMTFYKSEFMFIDRISEDKKEILDNLGLQYETYGVHFDPPEIPSQPHASYDERVKHWNDIIEKKHKEADALQKQGHFRDAHHIRQSYNIANTYFTLKDRQEYFAHWSKEIFGLNDKEYKLVLNTIKCGYFSSNGKKCDVELNTDHMFCNYHSHMVRSEKNMTSQIEQNKAWYKDLVHRL